LGLAGLLEAQRLSRVRVTADHRLEGRGGTLSLTLGTLLLKLLALHHPLKGVPLLLGRLVSVKDLTLCLLRPLGYLAEYSTGVVSPLSTQQLVKGEAGLHALCFRSLNVLRH
jgi:hypothetical protein